MPQILNIEDISLLNVSQFSGSIYYVDAGMTNDNGNGTAPSVAKQLFASAISAASAGDKIIVKAGTYDEAGLSMTICLRD